MHQKVKIAVICGTVRQGRLSIMAAKWVADQGRLRDDCDIVFVDPSDYPLPGEGESQGANNPDYHAIAESVDAFYIVTPEYNHSFPGSLKRLLDSEFAAYWHKPVATAGVSNGNWGGARACEALLPVYHTLGMVVVKPELYFPQIQNLFTEDGKLIPEHSERYNASVSKAYDELVWFARRLR